MSTDDDGLTTVSIYCAGTFALSGAYENLNIEINKAKNEISDTIALILDGVTIDNSGLTSNDPVISVGKNTADVVIGLSGSSTLKGAGAYKKSPANAVIYANDTSTTLTLQAYGGASDASLTIVDSMSEDTDYGDNDPSDGICSKGSLVIADGTYTITSNGDCLKGTGTGGVGGVTIGGGTLNLTSNLGNAIKSKNGTINIGGGTVNCQYTAGDAIQAKNFAVNITGGSVNIDNCYGDGIQGENVNITGGNVDIKTYYEYAGKNFYDSSLGTGNYNTISSSGDTNKTETVNVDRPGSH